MIDSTWSEPWDAEVAPLGPGPVLDVDTAGAVDVAQAAQSCRALLGL